MKGALPLSSVLPINPSTIHFNENNYRRIIGASHVQCCELRSRTELWINTMCGRQMPYVDVRGQQDNNNAQHRTWVFLENASIGFSFRFSPPPLKIYTKSEAYGSNGDIEDSCYSGKLEPKIYWTSLFCQNQTVHPVINVRNQLVGSPFEKDVTIECNVEASPKSINYWIKDVKDGEFHSKLFIFTPKTQEIGVHLTFDKWIIRKW